MFQMRHAVLLQKMTRYPDAKLEIAAAVRSAEAAGQGDVIWRAKLAQIGINGMSTHDAQKIVSKALDYGQRAGIYRLGVESHIVAADLAMGAGNFELAGDQIARAMTYASRYGMTLQKITLRVKMGRIMLAKGNRDGAKLLERAIAHSDRCGYVSAVQKAHEAMHEFGV